MKKEIQIRFFEILGNVGVILDELHDSQKKVDNMDFLIRQIQKEK